ncbi:MAG: PIG-L family deacetylase [Chloroflexota bacterium]
MRVLAIGAHPDDLEILCGGTLAKYCQQGHQVFMVHLANGSRGSNQYSEAELITIRRQEAREAARLIGAEYIEGGFANDLEIYPSQTLRDQVTDLIRMAEPDVIITLAPNDYSPDHNYTSQLVFDASHAVTIPLYKTKHKANRTPAAILFMDTVTGIGFQPEEYVDISDVIETKKQMILCHQSQQAFAASHRQAKFLENALVQSRFRGHQAGVDYAEGFRTLRLAMRGRAERVLP